MDLDQMTIAVRERNLAEVYDLGLQLCRRHWRALLTIYALLGIPSAMVTWFLATQVNPDGLAAVWYALLLVFGLQIPVLTAPVTLFLGQAMFNRRPSVAVALRDSLRHFTWIVILMVLRGIAVGSFVGLLLYPRQIQEVMLLEKPTGMKAAWNRAWRLAKYYFGENIAATALNLVFGLFFWFSVGIALYHLAQVLQLGLVLEEEVMGIFALRFFWPFLLVNALTIYFAVVSFAAYLDLRGRREGWEVELGLRRAGQRLRDHDR